MTNDIVDSVVLIDSQFSGSMRVVGKPTTGDGFVIVNLVDTWTSAVRDGVTPTKDDLAEIRMERPAARFGGKPRRFKLGLEALCPCGSGKKYKHRCGRK